MAEDTIKGGDELGDPHMIQVMTENALDVCDLVKR